MYIHHTSEMMVIDHDRQNYQTRVSKSGFVTGNSFNYHPHHS